MKKKFKKIKKWRRLEESWKKRRLKKGKKQEVPRTFES